MSKRGVSVLSTLALMASLSAADFDSNISLEHINKIPVIPKGKSSGIDAFQNREVKKVDSFQELQLSTKGVENEALISGVHIVKNRHGNFSEAERPRIGLVLSGGGARGGAHLGVIKSFERHNIPIDAIVGTSMGSFIGGLYASGMSSGEIERMLTTMDWNKVITVDYDRQKIPYRRKHLQAAFPGNAKVGVNTDNEVVFGTGLFKRQTMLQFLEKKTLPVSNVKKFDDLRIPFRSVASRLRDGERVVLRDGDLAEAIYASIAIPGGFDPIKIDGEVLVDGGVADNLPLDVMREEMDVDYIVVVDISTPYEKDAKFDNYISVMGQLVNILMRKNVEETVASMAGHDNEVLIVPDLEGYTPLDADKYPEIIAIGEKTAEAEYNKKLSRFSLYERDYYRYLADRPKVKIEEDPVIDRIDLDNGTYLNDEAILALIHLKVGDRVDHNQLEQDMMEIYDLMIFDDVRYRIVNEGGKSVLKILTTPSWDVNGQIKFALGFEDNFNGHSDYFVKLEYIKFGLNSYAGEWRTRVSFGLENLLLTELYQPLDSYGHFYLRPAIYYKNKKVYVTPDILDPGFIKTALDETFVMQTKDYGAVLGLGVNVTQNHRIEVGGDLRHVEPYADLLSFENFQYVYRTASSQADILDVWGVYEYDNLDNAFFPTTGRRMTAKIRYSDQFRSEGDELLNYYQYFLEFAGAFSYGKSTFAPRMKFGETFDVQATGGNGDFTNTQDFSSFYTLGGLFNLSGLPSNAVVGNNIAFASLVYRYRLSDDDFFGSLSAPLYVGASVESGTTWYGIDDFSTDMLIYSGSVYVAADTIIGPFYLGGGLSTFEEKNYFSIYISLGQSF